MLKYLCRKYPFKQSGNSLKDSLFYGAIVWAILYLLQPFGFSGYSGNKFLTAVLFGLVTSLCYAIYCRVFMRYILRHINPWRIWHQGCAMLGLIIFIAICNFFLFSFIFHYPITAPFFFMFLRWTMVIGIIITAIALSISYHRYLREKMEKLLSNTKEEQKDIIITIHDTNVRGNDLSISINSLLYIEAQKNNISVCYLKEGKPNFAEVHSTLSAVVEELKAYENIFQCHRSFVVNVNNITSAKGNSNGYQLILGSCTNSIPVSRSYVSRLKAYIA